MCLEEFTIEIVPRLPVPPQTSNADCAIIIQVLMPFALYVHFRNIIVEEIATWVSEMLHEWKISNHKASVVGSQPVRKTLF